MSVFIAVLLVIYEDLCLLTCLSLQSCISQSTSHHCHITPVSATVLADWRREVQECAPGPILDGKRIQYYSTKSFHKLHENKEYQGVTYPFDFSSILPHAG